MTTYTTISTGSLAVGEPLTSTIAIAFRDNPVAITEAASGAPVIQQAWHPYNKVTNGDANTGRIYDAAIDGAVANLVTPDFVDGFEYRLIFYRMGHSSGGSQDLQFEIYAETSAAYASPAIELEASVAATTGRAGGMLDLPVARSSVQNQFYDIHAGFSAVSGNHEFVSTAQKVTKVRVSFSSGNISAGKIWLYRRQAFPINT